MRVRRKNLCHKCSFNVEQLLTSRVQAQNNKHFNRLLSRFLSDQFCGRNHKVLNRGFKDSSILLLVWCLFPFALCRSVATSCGCSPSFEVSLRKSQPPGITHQFYYLKTLSDENWVLGVLTFLWHFSDNGGQI